MDLFHFIRRSEKKDFLFLNTGGKAFKIFLFHPAGESPTLKQKEEHLCLSLLLYLRYSSPLLPLVSRGKEKPRDPGVFTKPRQTAEGLQQEPQKALSPSPREEMQPPPQHERSPTVLCSAALADFLTSCQPRPTNPALFSLM